MSIFIEENKNYKINCNKAINLIELNSFYSELGGLLCDVDVVLELEDEVVFMEYKNSMIDGAKYPDTFDSKITSEEHYRKIARKYYDSIIYLNAIDELRKKFFRYYYVLESALADPIIRKRLAGKIKKKLPFEIQKKLPRLSTNLIDDFKVLSIKEWNDLHKDFMFENILGTNENI
ncbi:MAG: hypothetical protein LR001_01245 [Clostridiales bacterium]|nr:hypothetical protein [Clostridiales bacterium]